MFDKIREFFRAEKGRQPKSRGILSGLIPFFWSKGRPIYADSNLSAQLNCYRNWVYVASNRNAQTVAQVPLRLYKTNTDKNDKKRFPTKEADPVILKDILGRAHINGLPSVKKAINIEEVVEHPILDLMLNVNNFMNSFDLWEITQLYQELTGNAYWLIINNGLKRPSEIWVIPPDRIKIVPDPDKFIKGYLYEYGQFNQFIPEEMMIHFKMPNPNNMYYGISPLAAVKTAYSIANKMDEYELAVFENMGRLEGYFYTDGVLDDGEFERLKLQLKEAFIGHTKAGSAPLLENGLHYERFGLSPAELSYRDGRVEIKEAILNAYGQTLGLYSQSATRANASIAQEMYARQAIQPRCFRMEQKLNEKFLPRWDTSGKMFLAFDNCVPEDVLISSRVRAEKVRTGQISIDEARAQMRMPPYPNGLGAEPLFQVQYAPLSAIVSGRTLKPTPIKASIEGHTATNKMTEQGLDELADLVVQKMRKRLLAQKVA